jgi:signal transduction histidine kinase
MMSAQSLFQVGTTLKLSRISTSERYEHYTETPLPKNTEALSRPAGGEAPNDTAWVDYLIDSSPDLIATLNFDGTWLSLNPTGQMLLGWKTLDADLTIATQIPDYDLPIYYEEAFPTVLETGFWRGILAFQPMDGQVAIAMECQWFLVRDRYTNQPLCIGMINRLIQQAEEPQRQAQFFAEVCHELRTPLAVIHSSAEILETMSDRMSEERKEKHFQRIRDKVQQAARLLEDILFLSRTRQTDYVLDLELIDPVQFCAEMAEEAQRSTKQHVIEFTTNDESVGQVAVDSRLVERIVTNLLSNSIKYSSGGTISLGLTCDSGKLVFEVCDQGIGIPDQDQQWLFESFYRASNAAKIPGTGLGLSIVKKCVECHGGDIQVISSVNVGTSFKVEIPYECYKSGNPPKSP